MRDSVLTAIRSSSLQALNISTELPFDESGVSIYVKNPGTLYVDQKRIETQPLISTLDGLSISSSITSVTVYFATDSKKLTLSYDNNVEILKDLVKTIEFAGANARDAIVSTDYVGDLLITEVEYRITRLTR